MLAHARRGGRAPVVTVLRARAPSAQFWIRAKCAQERSKARSAHSRDPPHTARERHTMDTKSCSSCKKSKPSDAFLHPTTFKEGKTCAECIEKRSVASSRAANEQDKMQLTLSEHEAKLDDHESRIQHVEAARVLDAASPRADLAEWMPLKDPSEPVGPGDLVEMVDKKISRVVTGRGRCFVVSTAPILTGNVPDDETLATGRAVAMIGQVPVKVVGAVRESQCLAPSGRDDGTAAATDVATGISSMETVAAAGESVRLVTALVNAGSHALSKSQKRRQARKKKKAESFVVVGDDDADATSDVTTDLESLASTHACVQQLIDEKRALAEQLGAISEQNRAFARRMRVLHVDPNILRRVARGWLGRVRAARKLAAITAIRRSRELRSPRPCATSSSAPSSASRARACGASAASSGARAPLRRPLHARRRHAPPQEARAGARARGPPRQDGGSGHNARVGEAELASTKVKLSARDDELATAKGEIATMERELKFAVHASLCPATTATHAVPVEGASVLSRLTSAVKIVCKSMRSVEASVAKEITKDLKVEICGKEIWSDEKKYENDRKEFYSGTITEVLADGDYKVAMDTLTIDKKQYFCTVPASEMRFV
ncbi:tail collar domain protein [Aureococcus anophagefferens]|nr:tail collar domain protein [Aureococcus anophagefferens]